MHRRHPVIGVLGEKLVPLVEALLVEEPRLEAHEARQLGVGRRAHASAMNSRQARNWLRMEISLVPLAVTSGASISPGSKLRCRFTQSLPCAASPSWMAR